jgi:SAM-dependent methyltransferase
LYTVHPLTEEQYAQIFETFVQRSTEYQAMVDWSCNNLKRCDSMLSIGAGTGHFDRSIIGIVQPSIYYGIEPNPAHFEQLKCMLLDPKIDQDSHIQMKYFDQNTMIDRKFDLIIMSHSLYHMPNPIQMIQHARSFLNPGGQLVIYIRTDQGICEFCKRYAKYFDWTDLNCPYDDLSMSMETISAGLTVESILHQTFKEMAVIDLKDVPNNVDVTNQLLSFFIQTDAWKLPSSLRDQMIADLKAESMDQKFVHPCGMIVINN